MFVFESDVVEGALYNNGLASNGNGILLDLVRVFDYNDFNAAYFNAVS